MKVADYQRDYYEYSGLASGVARPLGLAGLGIIWIFKLDEGSGILLPDTLVRAAAWIVIFLGLDLLQYLYLAVTWLIIGYVYEKKYGHDAEGLSHSKWLPRVGEIIFALKMIALVCGFIQIGMFLWDRLFITPPPVPPT